MSRFLLFSLFFCFIFYRSFTQGFIRRTYYDADRKNLKEVYRVKDTIRNVLHGRYVSYFLNGNVESKGQFANNETIGVWEFYFETGKLKMRGILRQNSNYGLWEYYYEDGQKSMEGTINGKNREGEWKSYYENNQLKEIGQYKNNKRTGVWKNYYEDGVLKGQIEYSDDFGMFTEYHHTGKIAGEGPKLGTRYFGHWSFFDENSILKTEGDFINGKKNGEWLNYFPSGRLASKGNYVDDVPDGKWQYFFEDGKVNSSGTYFEGQKHGEWQVFNVDGSLKSDINFNKGSGEYKEYYHSGKLKAFGKYRNEKREDKWEYFYEDGKREGECQFLNGRGIYYGYFPNGNIQTKGMLEDEIKVGTWEIYENNGKLSGYYRPFYEDQKLSKEIVELAGRKSQKKKPNTSPKNSRFNYFKSRPNEFKGVIVACNPIFTFAGYFPVGFEFYNQERLGHEFEFLALRNPFFETDDNVPLGKPFSRGYSVAIKQKFYNPIGIGMWYFGHELRFTNVGHFVNVPLNSTNMLLTTNASEQRLEWGLLLGYRLMKNNGSKGFTIDAYTSADFGYRSFDVESKYNIFFSEVNQSKFSSTFHFGLNIGNVFSFK